MLSSVNNGSFLLALYQGSEILISVFFNFLGGALTKIIKKKLFGIVT
ncbi:hypothetical protein HMPREF9210_0593 [Lactobacillus iners SPIN 1401G]|uniref:Uncharacterized protein n=1 Tax=Lactobacillus iners LactinV 01V1-a TaxID=879297 RepID=E1NRN2_9LACO|nr:hypothetical protein HMPREF9212_1099 [Lactobacillus iners LactinV 03V1-b]EFO71229.1 hypothetical protein HMPREF9211_0516 [Lactobacillus iners LactinV 01V1-a]EFQ48875.1 hypothetical protein HMPREF9217_0571 [Lactobacillus iners LEAF 2052A-d]EFQ50065.1 hypothetical protein HMPREF9218_0931 [Lactobacillus iners LEAF 2062A-h1]EGC79024.1 conserved domain protein [Lactobacillus iners UPII 143-D]EGC80936.1 conserved domain protein [Lactobacillus iners UPII 60-B]EGG33520.1 hypothetical protein HMPRE